MAKTFSLKAQFSGICHFVPYQCTWKDQSGAMALIFPESGKQGDPWPGSKTALDTRALERHVPYMTFDPRQIKSVDLKGLPDEMNAVWYFDDYRLTFCIDTESSQDLTWKYCEEIDKTLDSFSYKEIESQKIPVSAQDMMHLAPLDHVAGDFCVLKKELMNPTQPCPPFVNAQILIDKGALAARLNEKVPKWKFSKILSNRALERPLAWGVEWTAEHIKSFKIKGTPISFEGGTLEGTCDEKLPFEIELRPWQGSQLDIQFGSFSLRNQLGWKVKKRAEVDEDFRWYYELLDGSQQKKIEKRLSRCFGRPRPLPVPVPVGAKPEDPSGNIRGVNCLPSRS